MAGADDREVAARARPALLRHRDLFAAREVLPGEALRVGQDVGVGAGRNTDMCIYRERKYCSG